MADLASVANVEDATANPKMGTQEQKPRKAYKRKRSSAVVELLSGEAKEALIKDMNDELHGLFKYYRELMDGNSDWRSRIDSGVEYGTLKQKVPILLEESELPLSKLANELSVKIGGNAKPAAVRNAVLDVAKRHLFGVPNAEADVLEDDNPSRLWCWETWDIKWAPKSVRGILRIRRTCRRKIHERIQAVSAMVSALNELDGHGCEHSFSRASEKLGKTLNEANIRLLVENLSQKNDADMTEKEAKREAKLLDKQLEKNRREFEKEKKKLESEKEKKRLESELNKEKLQNEAEKDQRRREKEEAELKKQLSIKKQASIMERFLKRSKMNPCQNEKSSIAVSASDSVCKGDIVSEAVVLSMDSAFSSNEAIAIGDIRRLHLSFWRQLGHNIHSNKRQHWGMRRKPKTELFKELKLSTSKGLGHDEEWSMEKLVSGCEGQNSEDRSCTTNEDSVLPDAKKCQQRWQLLQFDKSHRPAFYGIWPQKSHVVGPRHPFRKDPDLDYDIDSDEEWEEEDPGESLSDCDKDEEEGLDEGCSRADDEDESEDGFFVPDGYLSENEGVQVDSMEICSSTEDVISLTNSKQDSESLEFSTLLQQQKFLHNLTEHALRKNQPLIVVNLGHEKAPLLVAEDLSGISKLEQSCLQALSIRVLSGGLPQDISLHNLPDQGEETCPTNNKGSSTTLSTTATIQDSDLPALVSAILSCSLGINKVVESLQQKFPTVPKSQLKVKVREISEYVDNRWQVKKDVLDKLGLSDSPVADKGSGRRTRTIASFFSKRCLPPANEINANETSPQSLKPGSGVQGQNSSM